MLALISLSPALQPPPLAARASSSRRAVLDAASVALLAGVAPALPAYAAPADDVKETAAALKKAVDNKDAFIAGLASGDGSLLPKAFPSPPSRSSRRMPVRAPPPPLPLHAS